MFTRNLGEVDSVIFTNPYNSKGNQSFRTLLSKKIGSTRLLNPYDEYFNPLPHTPDTILRGLVSINKHPERQHEHKSYYNYSLESNISKATSAKSSSGKPQKRDRLHDSKLQNPLPTGVFQYDSLVIPDD